MLCCIPNVVANKKVKIDRFAIGNPTGFRHIAHMGTTSVSKNGFPLPDACSGPSLPVHLDLIDLPQFVSPRNEDRDFITSGFNPAENSYATNLTQPNAQFPHLVDSSRMLQHHLRPKSVNVAKKDTSTGFFNEPRNENFDLKQKQNDRISSLSKYQKQSPVDLSIPLPPPPPPPPQGWSIARRLVHSYTESII